MREGSAESETGVERKAYHDVTSGEWVEVEASDEKSRRWLAAQKLGCDESDIRRGYDHSDREPDETPVADGVLRDALDDDDLVTDGGRSESAISHEPCSCTPHPESAVFCPYCGDEVHGDEHRRDEDNREVWCENSIMSTPRYCMGCGHEVNEYDW